jgi:hypothetical protein
MLLCVLNGRLPSTSPLAPTCVSCTFSFPTTSSATPNSIYGSAPSWFLGRGGIGEGESDVDAWDCKGMAMRNETLSVCGPDDSTFSGGVLSLFGGGGRGESRKAGGEGLMYWRMRCMSGGLVPRDSVEGSRATVCGDGC